MTLPDAQQQELDRIMELAAEWADEAANSEASFERGLGLRRQDVAEAKEALRAALLGVLQRLTIAEAATREARAAAVSERERWLEQLRAEVTVRRASSGESGYAFEVIAATAPFPWESVTQKEGDQGCAATESVPTPQPT